MLDGITSTTAELNILDGVTSTAAELNILDGVTATAAELNIMDGVTATTAELNFVDGVTSNIQTQLDATLDTAGTGIDISSTTISVDVSDFMANGADNRVLTATGTDAMNAEANLTFDGTDLKLLGDDLEMRWGAGQDFKIYVSSDDAYLVNVREDKDIRFMVNDGNGTNGANITALKIDGSDAGTAIFNQDIRLETNATYLHSTDASGNKPRMFGMNSGNTTYIGPIDSYAGGSILYGSSANVVDQVFYTGGSERFRITSAGDIRIPATQKLYFDGGSHTYIQEQADDILEFVVGNDILMKLTESGSGIEFPQDSHPLKIGAGSDLQLNHNGTDSFVENYTGNLNIINNTDDGDIILKSDDGSGGVTPYLTLDGSSTLIDIAKNMRFADSIKSMYGASSDLQVYHNGTNSFGADNYTGALIFQQRADDQDIIFKCDDGSGGVTPYLTLDGSATSVNIEQDVKLTATKKLYLDGGGDSFIFEESANNVMFKVGNNNNLRFNSTGAIFNDAGASLDFRVEGDTDDHLFFVDGSADKVGISTNSPEEKLHLKDGNFRVGGDNAGSDYGVIFTPADAESYWHIYNDAGGHLAFGRSATIGSLEKMRIDSSGSVGIGTTSPEGRLHIFNGDASVCLLYTSPSPRDS